MTHTTTQRSTANFGYRSEFGVSDHFQIFDLVAGSSRIESAPFGIGSEMHTKAINAKKTASLSST
ncbi:MAG: hypothetical protein V7707_10795 [Motiliproteus sp.]